MSLYKIGRYLFGIDSSTKDRTANEDIDSLYSNTEEEHDNVNLHSSFSYTTNNDLLPINEQCQGNGTLPQINDTSEIINQGIAISHSTVSNTNHGQELRIINNSNFSLFFSGEFLYVSREQNVEDVLYNLQFPLTTNIDTFETLSCVLTRIVVEYFLYYFSLDFISVEKNFAKCLNNTGKVLVKSASIDEVRKRNNFSRRVSTVIANFADFLVLLHLYLCSETISTECIPSVWINLVDYVSDISNNDELKMLFISRYTMKNKNKKLNSNNKMLNTSMSWLRIENYYAEFNFKDSENTMSRILKIFEYSFSPNRRGEEGWILSEADMKEKLLHDFENTADVNQTGSIIIGSRNTNIKCLTPQASNILSSVRANAKEKLMEFFVCFEKTSTNALQLEERFMNRLKCDPNILEDLCLVIFKVSNPYKEMYGTNLIVNITFEEIFKAISISEGDFPDQRFNVELYEELTQLADHATNELIKQKLDIYYSSKRAGIEMYNKPLVDKDLAIDVEDMSLNSSLSIANCCALQFFNKLFIRICYEWNIIPENSKCCSSSGFANKYDGMFFPPGSTSEQIHWDYQTPVPDGLITPSSEFYGASLIVNSSSVSQIFQVHQWETQEFSSRKFTLKTFIRSAFSLTIIDGRLLHNEMENTSTWNYFSIIHADPANFSYANERKPIKLLSNSERNDGVSVVFQLNNNNITVEKVLGEGDRRNKSDDIMALLTVKENLSSMMEDVDLGEINWHMDNLLQQIRKRPRL